MRLTLGDFVERHEHGTEEGGIGGLALYVESQSLKSITEKSHLIYLMGGKVILQMVGSQWVRCEVGLVFVFAFFGPKYVAVFAWTILRLGDDGSITDLTKSRTGSSDDGREDCTGEGARHYPLSLGSAPDLMLEAD